MSSTSTVTRSRTGSRLTPSPVPSPPSPHPASVAAVATLIPWRTLRRETAGPSLPLIFRDILSLPYFCTFKNDTVIKTTDGNRIGDRVRRFPVPATATGDLRRRIDSKSAATGDVADQVA
jgi:hypothetical protein